jgi:YVTN family beta-propeller protein
VEAVALNDNPLRRTAALAVLAATVVTPARGEGDGGATAAATRFRQPVALAFGRDGDSLFVANRRSGSVSVVDVRASRVAAEFDVGEGLADLVAVGGGDRLLAVDQAGCALLLLDAGGRSVGVASRLAVAGDPVRVRVLGDGSECVVASRWSRRLTFVRLGSDGGPVLTAGRTVDLPFCPLEMAALPGGRELVVADAFGGKVALVDAREGTLRSVRTLPGHNIRGLAVSPDSKTLALAHQILSTRSPTGQEEIHWGAMIGNHLRYLRVASVLAAGSDDALLERGRLVRLGENQDGAGDPSAVAYNPRGDLVVALAGVGEVAISLVRDEAPFRVTVGARPTAVATSPDGSRAYVADTLDDTVSVVAIGTYRRLPTIPLGPRPSPGPADLGERLFYDAKLSHDNWLSCQSCHSDGHTSGLTSDTLGDLSYGAPKRVPSLLGVAATGPWTWTGVMPLLEGQVRKSVTTTMRGREPTAGQVEALTAYLRTLSPPVAALGPGPGSPVGAAARGREVFARECADCHAPPRYTTPGRYDVGLSDELGKRRFNPPSLLGVSRRGPLLHDGRAGSLDDLLTRHRHPPSASLSAEDIDDLIAFLETL